MTLEDLTPAVPRRLRQQADLTGSSELLWPYAPVAEAVRSIREAGLAILAVEVYGRLALARGNFYGDWPLEPGWQNDESWGAYVERTCTMAVAAIDADHDAASRPESDQDAGDRRYFLAVSTEAAYPQALRAADTSTPPTVPD